MRSQHHFLITFISDALSGNANQTRNHWTIQQDVRVPYFCWSKRKIQGCDKSRSKTSAWSYDLEGHAGKCVERYCELANKNTDQLCKVSSPCLDDHQIKHEELENKGELPEVCSHIVLKCLYLARIGRPDILWSVNKPARSVTKWTQACDRRLARLISNIHWTSDYRQYCNVGNAAQHCRLGSFQDSDFAADLEDAKSTSGGVLCIVGSRTFVPIKLDVQEANVSVSQLHSVRDNIIGCWFAYVWSTCTRLVGFGH